MADKTLVGMADMVDMVDMAGNMDNVDMGKIDCLKSYLETLLKKAHRMEKMETYKLLLCFTI